MRRTQKPESVHLDAARLLKRHEKRLPELTTERRRRIVSAVAADLERQHASNRRTAA